LVKKNQGILGVKDDNITINVIHIFVQYSTQFRVEYGFAWDKSTTLSSSVQGEFGGEPTMNLLLKIQPTVV
jgi:hypothetical protein